MSSRIAKARMLHRVNRGGPVALLGVFALLAWALAPLPVATARFAAIEAAIGDIPYAQGDWYGVDVELPAAAEEILRPTAVFARRYTELGGARGAILGFVHCSDVRDMLGHHPPRCYPASGWRSADGAGSLLEIEFGGGSERARLFRFERVDSTGLREEISVLGLFILPDGRCVSEEAEVALRGTERALSNEGLAQLQIVVQGWASAEEIADIADELLGVFPRSLLEALGRRASPGDGGEAGSSSAGSMIR